MAHELTQEFDSFEAFDAYISGWDTRFDRLHGGDCRTSLRQVSAPGFLYTAVDLNTASLQQGAAPSGMRTFALPLAPTRRLVWRDYQVETDSLLVFPEGGDLFALTEQSFSVLALSIDSALLESSLDDASRDGAALLADGAALAVDAPSRQRLVRQAGIYAEFQLKYAQARATDPLVRLMEEDMVQALVEGLGRSLYDQRRLPAAAAARLVRRAIAFTRQDVSDVLLISDICDAIGTSRRSLEMAFQRCLGVSPKRYLKRERLLRCHLALLSVGQGNVSQVAARFGFIHMGQFSSDYRRLFGELPNATLARRPG